MARRITPKFGSLWFVGSASGVVLAPGGEVDGILGTDARPGEVPDVEDRGVAKRNVDDATVFEK